MKKRTIIYLVSAILLVGIIGTTFYYFQSTKTAQTEQKVLGENVNKDVIYKGQDGVTALALLEKNAKIVTSGTGDMAFVATINSVTADPNSEYWQFSVDGKSASVGAGSYITKNNESISWKLVKL
jgi:hypothetical protein